MSTASAALSSAAFQVSLLCPRLFQDEASLVLNTVSLLAEQGLELPGEAGIWGLQTRQDKGLRLQWGLFGKAEVSSMSVATCDLLGRIHKGEATKKWFKAAPNPLVDTGYPSPYQQL